MFITIKKTLIKGFTITELLIGIAILGLLTAIAVPNLNEFYVQSRVSSEISEIHKLILTARNSAINSGKNITICPLSSNKCVSNWQNEVSVFDNSDNTVANNEVYDSSNESIIKVKAATLSGDTIKFAQKSIVFAPTGRLISGGNSKISYCPKGYSDLSRGLEISLSGRVYITSDSNNDGKDENRDGTVVSCT